MKQLPDRVADGAGRRSLIVFLPGAYDAPEDFASHGFISALRRRGIAADVVAIDSHLGYFQNGSIAQRLRDEVVLPAREQGYQSLWLVGISLGGLGAMLYATRHEDLSGIVALAPYIGTRAVIDEVRGAGGLAQWRPAATVDDADWERRLLLWLQRIAGPAPDRPAAGDPTLVLAYGREDRFADSLDLVARSLPADRVVTAPGGHEWDTWSRLWNAVLDRHGSRLAAAATPAAPTIPSGPAAT